MKVLKFSCLALMLIFWGCSGNTASDSSADSGAGTGTAAPEKLVQIDKKSNSSGAAKLEANANPCDYFTEDLIKKYFKTGEKKVTVRKSSIGDEYNKNCMGIWAADKEVSELLVDGYKHIAPALSSKFKYSLGTNQAEGWATDFINNLIKEGDSKTVDHNATYNYVQLADVGDAACWSREKSHLVWRRGNDIFEVYVNVPLSEANRKAYATALALDLNSQF